jgi:hypothetical protein
MPNHYYIQRCARGPSSAEVLLRTPQELGCRGSNGDGPERLPASASPRNQAVYNYLAVEAGRVTPLSNCLRRGVSYHYSGLSHEVRWMKESLIRRRFHRKVHTLGGSYSTTDYVKLSKYGGD